MTVDAHDPSAGSTPPVRAGDRLELEVTNLAHGGDGVARHEGLVVFVPFGAPGDRVAARVTSVRGTHARARIERVLRASPDRRSPACAHFGVCGGCQLQHLAHPAQLAAKAAVVRESLRRIAGVDPGEVEVHAAAEFGYRNRVRLGVDHGREPPAVGFRRAGSHAIEAIETCPVLVPPLAAALGRVRELARRGHRLPAELELTAGDDAVAAADASVTGDGGIAGFAATVERRIGDATYRAGAATFFQGNATLVERLTAAATSLPPGVASFGCVVELYCGIGLFTVPLARRATRVLAVEASPQAVQLAQHNLAANGIANVELHRARAEDWLRDQGGKWRGRVDLLLLDPPRTGAREAVASLVGLGVPHVRYVSCDPATLARDVGELLRGGYELAGVQAFDLFPQTYHVEVLATLQRRRLQS